MNRSLHRPRGFSLVVSLIVLTLLAVMVVAFLSTTTLDRATARAFLSKQQAESAAAAASNQAMSLLREYLGEFPDSVTYWEPLAAAPNRSGVSATAEGTILYYYDRPPPGAGVPAGPTSPQRYVLPLMSRGIDPRTGRLLGAVPVEQKAAALGADPWFEDSRNGQTPNCIDLNRPRFNGDTAGWIGSPPPAPGTAPIAPKPRLARWIEVKEHAPPGTHARTIGRYAFWIEDESFKLNLNALDNHLANSTPSTGRGVEMTFPGPTAPPGENDRLDAAKPLPPQLAGLVPLPGLLAGLRTPAELDPVATSAAIKNTRDAFNGRRLPELRSFNQIPLSYDAGRGAQRFALGDQARFLATAFSGALNLSRHGSQRLNLNGLGLQNATPTQPEMDRQVHQIVEAMKWHAPKFGQRFYRTSYKGTEPTDLADARTVNELRRRNLEVVPEPAGGMQPGSVPFGQPGSTTAATHSEIYLHKIATNIRDYIDPDAQPTLVKADGRVENRQRMEFALSGDGANRYLAQGKESAPYLQEVVERFRTETIGREYRLRVDYYIELWNMTGRDIRADDLGPNPFLRINYAVGWASHPGLDLLTGTPPPEEGHPCVLNLSGLGIVFRAGACTVITSNPSLLDSTQEFVMVAPYTTPPFGGGTTGTTGSYRPPLADGTPFIYSIPLSHQVGAREFRGPLPTGKDGFWPIFRDGTPTPPKIQKPEDYQTEVVFGNDLGVLDCSAFAVSKGGDPNVTYVGASLSRKNARDDTFGGSLRGNANFYNGGIDQITPSQTGDPRTNNEQLRMKRYDSSKDADQTRYFNPDPFDNPRFSLGWPNSRFLAPYLDNNRLTAASRRSSSPPFGYPWADYYKVWPLTLVGASADVLNADANTAPLFVLDRPLASIGQLGDIFDPARVSNPNGTLGLEYARGGGRTLKIGQSDDLVDMLSPTAASRGWAAWRLADFLSVSGEVTLPGAININGVRRDKGAALRAACLGLQLRCISSGPASTTPMVVPAQPLKTSEAAPAEGFQRWLDAVLARMTDNDPTTAGYSAAKPYFGPFVERGELSEFPIFNTTQDLVSGLPMNTAFDRTREEFARRLLETVTTRGNIFSVYAIGESIVEARDVKHTQRATATHSMKTTFALIPKKADGTDFKIATETFDPANAASVRARFAPPHHYDVQILQITAL